MNSFADWATTILNLLGSLALFMFAMQQLSRSLQNVIGEQIELVLRKLTNRPYKGMITGTLVTFLTQSSSVTVLTLIGLVNVGVLSLRQGVGIILGSEIGTTMTAQLVTLKVEKLYFPIIILGFVLATFIKNKHLQAGGKAVFAFGLLFLGMEFMKESAAPLAQSQYATDMFGLFGRNPFLGIVIGAIFTSITSSSSATTSLVVALGAAEIITLPAAIALVLGANIGTCTLELIASAGMALTAKRVAYAQAVINILGVIVIYPFIMPFSSLMSHTSSGLAHQIANSHTVFNVGSSLIFLFLVNVIVAIVTRLVPGEVIKIERGAKYIDPKLLKTPHIALMNSTKEVERVGNIIPVMLDCVKQAVTMGREDLLEAVVAQETQLDALSDQLTEYLTAISENELDAASSERVAQLLHGVADIERIGDHLNRIAEEVGEQKKADLSYSKEDKQGLVKYLDLAGSIYAKSLQVFMGPTPEIAPEISDDLKELRAVQAELLRGKHGKWGKRKRAFYEDLVHHVERMANHADSLAQIVVSGF